jgi:hypothetical protein
MKRRFFMDEREAVVTQPGGAFGRSILDELLRKHACGIVSNTLPEPQGHGGKTSGINGVMASMKNLFPLYQLATGKP